MNSPAKPTFILKTLGCKVNQYETQAMRESLTACGFSEKTACGIADFYIINSCTVTGKADKETRNLIRRNREMNPGAKIVITGCYAELDRDRSVLMAIPGVTHLIRNSEKADIGKILRPNSHAYRFTRLPAGMAGRQITNFKGRDRAFIKIQDGCDNKCSYCKVNLVRGPSRSRPAEDILAEAGTLIRKGLKEIVLTGICLGSWGKGTRGTDLARLLGKISGIDGLFKIRLSSIEPLHVTDRLIDTVKRDDKVCKHFHVPLQSGDDRVLKLMSRPYGAKKFKHIIKKIRSAIPEAAFTTDVLVGFPGEDERSFANTVEFIETIKPSRMHVFAYSKREGTPASRFESRLTNAAAKKRVKTLTSLNRKLSMDFAKRFVGKDQDAVIESVRVEKTGLLTGYTDRYIRVLLEGPDSLKNSLKAVQITRVEEENEAVYACLSPACHACRQVNR